MFRIATALALSLLTMALISGAQAQTAGPPAPTNLECTPSQTSISCAWGPAQPGEIYKTGEGKNYIMVAWGLSQDSRGPVTYTLTKDGTTLASGLTTNTYRVSTSAAKRPAPFRTCVTASLADGRSSPPMCTTWSK